jgi:predicted nuclease of restriction endonuclease-like (RecB) superfamily
MKRQIDTSLYECLLIPPKEYKSEIASQTQKTETKMDADYILKDSYTLEFLDLKKTTNTVEANSRARQP